MGKALKVNRGGVETANITIKNSYANGPTNFYVNGTSYSVSGQGNQITVPVKIPCTAACISTQYRTVTVVSGGIEAVAYADGGRIVKITGDGTLMG